MLNFMVDIDGPNENAHLLNMIYFITNVVCHDALEHFPDP